MCICMGCKYRNVKCKVRQDKWVAGTKVASVCVIHIYSVHIWIQMY